MSGYFYKRSRGNRQLDPTCGTDKQLNTQLALQRLDLRRQGGLGNMHTCRCPAEMHFLGNRNEVGELAQFHGSGTLR